MTLLTVITYLIIPVLGSVFLFYTLADAIIKMGCNLKVKKKQRIPAFVIYSAAALLVILCFPPEWTSMISFLTLVAGLPVMGHIFCNSGRIYVVYYVGLTMAAFVLDILLSVFYQYMIQAGMIYFIQAEFYNLVYIAGSKLITFMLAKGYVYLVRKKESQEISRKQYYASLLLPFTSIIYVYTLLHFMQVYLAESSVWLFLVNIVMIIGLNIYYPIQEKNRDEAFRRDLDRTWEELEHKRYEELERKLAQSQSMLHDIRGHVQTMERLYQESASVQAQEYAKSFHQMLNELGEQYYTDNRVLNIILNDKARMMKQLRIEPEILVRELELTGYKDTDITIIFGNLLDNAIEALRKSKDKSFQMRAGRIGDFMSFVISNGNDGDEGRTEARIKKGKEFQGIGLRNVERSVEKYQGEIEYEAQGNRFVVKLMLPVGKMEREEG